MSSLMANLNAKALQMGIPLSAHLDVTYRCNEKCVHCYLDHDDKGEMTTAEVKDVLDQMASTGVLFLTISGGEPFLRRDIFEIIEHARRQTFNIKLKSNAILIREKEARRLRDLNVDAVQISIYSHRAEVHDEITKVPGSLKRSLAAARFLVSQGVRVTFANVLMQGNRFDYPEVRELATGIGARFTIDPTITPHMNGDRSLIALNISADDLRRVLHDESLRSGEADACAAPGTVSDDDLDNAPCSAGHTSCYVSPYGDVFPCVQFPLPSGNVRRQKFSDIWYGSRQLEEVRGIRVRDLPVCSTCTHATSCTRCPGLAYMQGDMRGPSIQDCEKSYARTGIPTANMIRRRAAGEFACSAASN
jgi:radical SAM protein with 4Fe4S-binding SPASM domain